MHALRLLALGIVFLLLLGGIATMEQIEYRTAWGNNRNLIRGDSNRRVNWLNRNRWNRRSRWNYRKN